MASGATSSSPASSSSKGTTYTGKYGTYKNYQGKVVVPEGKNYVGKVSGMRSSTVETTGSGAGRVSTVVTPIEEQVVKVPMRDRSTGIVKDRFATVETALREGVSVNRVQRALGMETARVTDVSMAGKVLVGGREVPLAEDLARMQEQGQANVAAKQQTNFEQQLAQARQQVTEQYRQNQMQQDIAATKDYLLAKQDALRQGLKEHITTTGKGENIEFYNPVAKSSYIYQQPEGTPLSFYKEYVPQNMSVVYPKANPIVTVFKSETTTATTTAPTTPPSFIKPTPLVTKAQALFVLGGVTKEAQNIMNPSRVAKYGNKVLNVIETAQQKERIGRYVNVTPDINNALVTYTTGERQIPGITPSNMFAFNIPTKNNTAIYTKGERSIPGISSVPPKSIPMLHTPTTTNFIFGTRTTKLSNTRFVENYFHGKEIAYGAKEIAYGAGEMIPGIGGSLYRGTKELIYYSPLLELIKDIKQPSSSYKETYSYKKAKSLALNPDVQSTAVAGAIALAPPLAQFGAGVFFTVQQALVYAKEPTPKRLGELVTVAGLSMLGFKESKIGQFFEKKLSPSYVPYVESGVRVVEDTTIPTSYLELKGFEGTKVDTIHTSFNAPKYGTTLIPGTPENVGASRAAIGQFNFYQSLPNGKPVAYGGYIGIGDAYSAGTKVEFRLLNPKRTAIIFRGQEISPTPSSIIRQGIPATVEYQTTTPGTFIPAENIFGRSLEGQATTSVGTIENPIFKIDKNVGAELEGKFTYYNEKKPVPNILGGASKGSKLINDIIKTPEKYVKDTVGEVKFRSQQQAKIVNVLKGEDIAFTGGVARKAATGKGTIRDLDIVVLKGEGKLLAEKVAAKYPGEFQVIQHEKYPEIFRIKDVKSGKVIADFDPLNIAEEGLLKKNSFVKAGEQTFVKPSVMLKSKATQIQKGKLVAGGKQFKNIEQLTSGKVTGEALKNTEKTTNVAVKKVWDVLTSKNYKINFMEAKLERVGAVEAGSKIVDMAEYGSRYGKTEYVTAESAGKKVAELSFASKAGRAENVMGVSKAESYGRGIESVSSRALSLGSVSSGVVSLASKSSGASTSSASSSMVSSSAGKSFSSDFKSSGVKSSRVSVSSGISSSSGVSEVSGPSSVSSLNSSSSPIKSSGSFSSSRGSSSSSIIKSSFPSPPPSKSKDKKKKVVSELGPDKARKGFIALLKRRGKFSKVSPVVSREAALDIGAMASKRSLGATFKIEEASGVPISGLETGYYGRTAPSFRTYKVVKGRPVALVNTFIEKRGTRLSTPQERTEIRIAKRTSPKGFKNRFLR